MQHIWVIVFTLLIQSKQKTLESRQNSIFLILLNLNNGNYVEQLTKQHSHNYFRGFKFRNVFRNVNAENDQNHHLFGCGALTLHNPSSRKINQRHAISLSIFASVQRKFHPVLLELLRSHNLYGGQWRAASTWSRYIFWCNYHKKALSVIHWVKGYP